MAAADAASMFQRMSSTMSVATAPVPIQCEEKQGNEGEKMKDDATSDRLTEENVDEAGIKAIEDNHEGEEKEDTIETDTSMGDNGLIVGWPSMEEKDQGDEDAKGSTFAEDVVADGKDIARKDEFPATNDSVQFGGDTTTNANVVAEDTNPPIDGLVDNSGQAAEVEDEEAEALREVENKRWPTPALSQRRRL